MPEVMTCRAGAKLVIDRPDAKGVVLEEYAFKQAGEFPMEWEHKLTSLLSDTVLANAAGRFVLLSDGDLSNFAVNACQVNQHVRIDDETGTADDGGLFNEETVPSETLLYSAFTTLRRESGKQRGLRCPHVGATRAVRRRRHNRPGVLLGQTCLDSTWKPIPCRTSNKSVPATCWLLPRS